VSSLRTIERDRPASTIGLSDGASARDSRKEWAAFISLDSNAPIASAASPRSSPGVTPAKCGTKYTPRSWFIASNPLRMKTERGVQSINGSISPMALTVEMIIRLRMRGVHDASLTTRNAT